MNYKGYTGCAEYDDSARVFHGEVVDTRDVITFEGTSVDEIEEAFRESVDDYLDFCEQRGSPQIGRSPDGSWSVSRLICTASSSFKRAVPARASISLLQSGCQRPANCSFPLGEKSRFIDCGWCGGPSDWRCSLYGWASRAEGDPTLLAMSRRPSGVAETVQSVIFRGSDERVAAISRGDHRTIMGQAALAIWDSQTNTRQRCQVSQPDNVEYAGLPGRQSWHFLENPREGSSAFCYRTASCGWSDDSDDLRQIVGIVWPRPRLSNLAGLRRLK